MSRRTFLTLSGAVTTHLRLVTSAVAAPRYTPILAEDRTRLLAEDGTAICEEPSTGKRRAA